MSNNIKLTEKCIDNFKVLSKALGHLLDVRFAISSIPDGEQYACAIFDHIEYKGEMRFVVEDDDEDDNEEDDENIVLFVHKKSAETDDDDIQRMYSSLEKALEMFTFMRDFFP
jgi:hypothetical protein